MSTSLNINSIDKASLVDWKSVRREQVLTREADKLSFLIKKFNSQTYKPTIGDEVIFETTTEQIQSTLLAQTNNIAWTLNFGTYTDNSAIAPDGTTTAQTHTYTLGNNSNWDLYKVYSGFTPLAIYKVSMWVKLGTSTNFSVVVNDTTAWNTIGGQVFTTSDGLSTTTWKKISYYWTQPTARTSINLHLGANANNLANQTAGTVFIWGVHIQQVLSLTPTVSREFGGYIVELQEDVEGRVEYIKCICKDYTHQLDRQLVSKTYEAMTVNAIIADLTTTFATGITDNNVDCTTVIDSVTFNYLPISQCLQRLTDIVEGYDWYIDYDKDVHFFFSDSVASSFDLTDTSGNYVYNSLALRQDTHQLRNEVIVRGGLLTSTTLRTEYLSGDATKDTFPLATKFANLPVVEISSVAKTVGIENLDTTGFDCYWNYNEKSLKFTTPPASGTSNITVTEYPQYPLILQKRNEASITSYGLFQSVIVDKNIRDLDTAGLRADVELLKYSEPEKTADFLTYTAGLRTGQTINIQSTIRGISQDYKIQNIRSSLHTPNTDELVHEVSCVTAEDLGINDILARLLIKNPSDQIQIDADEFVSRIRQLTESFTIVDSTPTNSKTSGPYKWTTGTTTLVWGFGTWS
jgi:hypothetical protein